jgi:hypothetical protein
MTKEVILTPTTYYNVEFIVKNGSNPLSGATILFDNKQGLTDIDGKFVFDSVSNGLNKKYTITKDKYFQYIDSVNVDTNLTVNVEMKLELYSVTFQVTSNVNSGPLEGVNVNFNAIDQLSNASGLATFSNVEPKSGINYTLTKTGFINLIGSLDILHENKTVYLTMSVISAIEDITKESVSVFPNPSQGIINIDLALLKTGYAQIEIYDILGKSVYNKDIIITENTKEVVDLSNQAKGIYFISIKTSSGEKFSRKIILK